MKNRLYRFFFLVITLSTTLFYSHQIEGQVHADKYQKEHKNIQLLRAQYFDKMRRFVDGSYPDTWKEFQKIKQHAGSRNLVPAASWTSLGPNTMDSLAGRMTCHAFNPLNSKTILSGSSSGGLWKTTDGANNWYPLTDDLPSIRISAVAYHPQDTNHILIGTGFFQNAPFTLVAGIGVLESFDGGETWLPNTLEFPFSQGVAISRIVWDESNPSRVYIGSSLGVWVSENSGQTWNNTLSGNISDLEIIKATTERLYAAIHSVGIYRSDNNGQDWTLLSNGLPSNDLHRINIAVCDSAPGFALASIVQPGTFGLKGLYKTSNGGDSWELVDNPPSYLCNSNCLGWFANVVEISPVDTNIIFLGGPRFYRTIDSGQSWQWRDYYSTPFGTGNIGVVYVDQWDAGFDPMEPEVAYVFNDGGVFRSSDNGFFWEKKNEGLVTGQFYRIASFPGDTSLMIGGIQDHGLHYLDNTNGNTTWNIWWIGDGCSVNFDPNNPNKVYGDNLFGFHYRNTNVTSGFSTNLNFNNGIIGTNSVPFHFVTTHHPTESNILYTANDDRIFKSTNGLSWNTIANISNVRALAISPANPSTLYAATYTFGASASWAFYVSHDDGETWNQTANSPGWRVTDVEGDPNIQGTVYATRNSALSGNPHVYKSTDYGESWMPISNGLPDISTWTITINPFDSNVLYVGTDLGVYISDDGGLSWNEYNDNLPPYYVMDMHYHPLDSTLRIATLGRGVWKTKSIPDNLTGPTELEIKTTSLEIFPNPFSSATNIKFDLEETASVRLSVLNVLGQHVKLLYKDKARIGQHNFIWDGRNEKGSIVPKGIYFIRLDIRGYKFVRQIIFQ
ncbi:MAG: T9SS type A sorting domain-containing protein [Chitinophagales bacterium]|nr:T9SS type A sorting domain-containing protein [Chitinophagales bacterium]